MSLSSGNLRKIAAQLSTAHHLSRVSSSPIILLFLLLLLAVRSRSPPPSLCPSSPCLLSSLPPSPCSYYGKSQPVPNMSLDNLRFLTSEQAQADLARFIDFISSLPTSEVSKKQVTPALDNKFDFSESEWVSFGGSYPGNMATWLKLKYPSKVRGFILCHVFLQTLTLPPRRLLEQLAPPPRLRLTTTTTNMLRLLAPL